MIGDHDDLKEVDEIDDDLDIEESSDEIELSTANVGETSVEIDVEELIAENPLADLEARWGGRGPEYTEQTLRIFYSDLSGS